MIPLLIIDSNHSLSADAMHPVTVLFARQAKAVTMEDAVRIALTSSPRIRALRFEADAQVAHSDREKPTAHPRIAVEAHSYAQGPELRLPRSTPGSDVIVPEFSSRLEFSIEQTLWANGRKAASDRILAMRSGAELDYDTSRNDLVRDVVRAWYGVVGAEQQKTIACAGMRLARDQVDQTKKMLAEGLASKRDLLASEADAAESEAGFTRALNGVQSAREAVSNLIGRNDIEIDLRSTLPLKLPATVNEAQKSAERDRPEIKRLLMRIKEARAGESLTRSQGGVTVSARAIAAAQTATALTNDTTVAAGLVLRWNPFDRAIQGAEIREAAAGIRALEARLEELTQGIRLQVQAAWRDREDAKARVVAGDRQVAAAEAALNISRARYSERAALQLEVSASLVSLLRAQTQLALARLDILLAELNLSYAIGAVKGLVK